MLRGSGRMIQRATTTGSLPLFKNLLRTLLKRVSVSRRQVASFLAGTRYQPGHLTEFCRKCSLCYRSIAVSWSGNPTCSIKEVARDSCSSTRLGTHRYSGDDSQSGCGTQAITYSDRTRSQGTSSDPGEGSLARDILGRFLQRASTRCRAVSLLCSSGSLHWRYLDGRRTDGCGTKSLAAKPPIRIISAGSSVGRSTMARGTVKWFNPT